MVSNENSNHNDKPMYKGTSDVPLTPKQIRRYKKMFGCDSVRISRPAKDMYLILGWEKDTRYDTYGTWYKDGKPYHFKYIDERVVARGRTHRMLLKDAKRYKKLIKKDKDNGRLRRKHEWQQG